MRMLILFACIFCFFCLSSKACDDIEISGLLINQTKTRIGHEFYQYFTNVWQKPSGIDGYNIVISEKISAQYGSVIWITVNDISVYKKLLNRRVSDIDEIAKKSANLVGKYIISKYSDNVTIHKQYDLSGNGLY